MPIYEFYCSRCHRIYNFFSRTIQTDKQPDCPRCGKPRLKRCMSRFAIGAGRSDRASQRSSSEGGPDQETETDWWEDLPPGFDEEKFERAMEELASEADGLDEDDPRQMGRLMRKVCEAAGMPIEGPMAEAIRRLESGEDPDKIEEDLGEELDQLQPPWEIGPPAKKTKGKKQTSSTLRGWVRKMLPPEVDETLYDL
ncbi:MAG: zinc ribbon domain-containing protein [Thermoguttaceae bacterium]|nr:zinc ribbon domain-containing protein [Thermoguttaceae bacterium]MDW8038228.1 zinc ribbon domain-containing protein [Thermoguttaceae bacterium]